MAILGDHLVDEGGRLILRLAHRQQQRRIIADRLDRVEQRAQLAERIIG